MSAKLFFGECTFVLVRHFGTERWAGVFWMLLSETTQSVEAQGDLRNVATFKQVGGLENFFFWDSVLLDGGLESKKSFPCLVIEEKTLKNAHKPLNIFHQLEVCATLLDLLDASWSQLVGKLAENDAILQDVFVLSSWNFLTQNSVDPFENFLLLLLVALLETKSNVTDEVKSFELSQIHI